MLHFHVLNCVLGSPSVPFDTLILRVVLIYSDKSVATPNTKFHFL